MRRCWVLITLGLWFSLPAVPAAGQGSGGLAELIQAYRSKPSPAARAALLKYAEAHPEGEEGALALLALGAGEAEGEDASKAAVWLREAKQRLPALADYAAYHLARALMERERHAEAITELEWVLNFDPRSPHQLQAILRAGEIYLESGNPRLGVELMRRYAGLLPAPEGLAIKARLEEAAGMLSAAAATWQEVYYGYPVSREAQQASVALRRLKARLRSRYPPVTAEAMFRRVDKLIRARRHLTARRELQEMTTSLGGADRDRARVWLGKARHIRRHDTVAYRWLKSLKVSDPEADAERLYYLLAAARRLGRKSEVVRIVRELDKKHPHSEWRLEALVSAGNMYLLENDHERFLPFYRACAEDFPESARAPYCHWKIAWSHYIRRRPEAAELLRLHVKRYPGSNKAPAALYFLGRLAERSGNKAAAAAWYHEAAHQYPNWYYGFLAQDRLEALGAAGGDGEAAAEVHEFLATVEFPVRRHRKNFDPTPLTETRLRRGRLLLKAGLRSWGERELRWGARTGAQGPILAMELARAAAAAGRYGQSIRFIKALAPGYLSMALEDAPEEFWRLAFPLPYQSILEKYARRRNLDVYFLAALIRQESEFDTRAVSRARARGLTQILPSTGRLLARKLRIRGYRTSYLYQPEINVNMGTYYLRSLIDDLDGHTEAALASYNAGRTRVRRWLRWAEFGEPAEFVETIPFTETRTYVQTVLRNTEIYRRLYGAERRAAVRRRGG